MSKINRIVLLVVMVLLIIAWMPIFAMASTTPSGISLLELEEFIDGYAAEHIGKSTTGAVVAVIKDGEVVLSKAYGYAIQNEIIAGIDSVFEWGSATKLLIWTSVMQLVEQGKLDLNTDIRQYLQEGFLKKLKYNTPITMYHLMHHNAGWEERYLDLFYSSPDSISDLKSSLLVYEPAQVNQPGAVVAYSNYGTAVAGYIVECITGQPFYEYVWDNIFVPLGMTDTALHPTQSDNPVIAEKRSQIIGYVKSNEELVPSKSERVYLGMYPAGSAIGTIEDATKFITALMPAPGEKTVLFDNRETLDKMLSTSFYLETGIPFLAHGFWETEYTVRTIGHSGNTDSFSSNFTLAPDERFGIVVMTNQAGETAMCYGLPAELYGKYLPSEYLSDMPNAHELAGLYLMARKPVYGFTKVMGFLMNMLPLAAIDENTIIVANEAVYTQISPYVFQHAGESDALAMLEYIYFNVDNGKVLHASALSMYAYPMSSLDLAVLIGSGIILAICVLYALTALVLSIIGKVKNKKWNIESNVVKKLNVALYVSMIVAIINNVLLIYRAFPYPIYSSLMPHLILNAVYIIFTPICVSMILYNRKKEPLKRSRVFTTLTCIASILLAIMLAGWELWR